MPKAIYNHEDIIDSRDIDERIEELESLRDDAETTQEEKGWNSAGTKEYWISDDFGQDEIDELEALITLREDCSHPEWKYGLGLIRESYWEDYAQQTAEDMYGKELREARWPFDHIDWEAAADALRMDYSQVEFGDVTYLYRS